MTNKLKSKFTTVQQMFKRYRTPRLVEPDDIRQLSIYAQARTRQLQLDNLEAKKEFEVKIETIIERYRHLTNFRRDAESFVIGQGYRFIWEQGRNVFLDKTGDRYLANCLATIK